MNKIFINNFHTAPQVTSLASDEGKKPKLILGYDLIRPQNEIKRDIIKNVLNSLLIHDKVVFPIRNFFHLLVSFDISDTIQLLKSESVELVDDKDLLFPIIEYTQGKKILYETGAVRSSLPAIQNLEILLRQNVSLTHAELNLLLLNAEKRISALKTGNIDEKVFGEIEYDLKNENLTTPLNIATRKRSEVSSQDIFKILRLLQTNAALAYALETDSDTILSDGAIKDILQYKTSPLLNKRPDSSINLFSDLTAERNIPDLGELYIQKILSIDNILSIRNNFNGKKFRTWLYENEFNKEETINSILKINDKLGTLPAKAIRFFVTNAIGLVSPIVGLAASAVDSFVLDKVFNGWHPNFFLDNVLKKEIDEKIKKHDEMVHATNIKKRFPTVSLNGPCPCNSGKKFKRCCGKI